MEDGIGAGVAVVVGGQDVGFVVGEGEDGIEGGAVAGGVDLSGEFVAGLAVEFVDVYVGRVLDAAANDLAGLDFLSGGEAAVGFFFVDDGGGIEEGQGAGFSFALFGFDNEGDGNIGEIRGKGKFDIDLGVADRSGVETLGNVNFGL